MATADDIAAKTRQCKRLACLIQTCLKQRNYSEERCSAEINRWRTCAQELAALELALAEADGTKIEPRGTSEPGQQRA